MILVVIATLPVLTHSQETIQGTLPDWSLGSGEVVSGLREPVVVGSVDEDGTFTIPLRSDFLATIKAQVEAEDPEKGGGWRSSLLTLRQVFSCYGENIEVVNGGQPVTRMTSMGVFNVVNMAEKKRLGYMIATSSEDFAGGLMELGAFNFKKGYFVDWLYIEEAGSVKGSCTTESYAVNQEENYSRTTHYEISLQPGWNLIKYEILDLFTDRDGKTYPMEERFVSLTEAPADMKFIFMAD
jgi:hypothetical protein